MTTPARIQTFTTADEPQSLVDGRRGTGAASGATAPCLSSLAPTPVAAGPTAGGGGRFAFEGDFAYEGDPDVPVGVTLPEWRRRNRPLPKLGPVAQVRAWLRWHMHREEIA